MLIIKSLVGDLGVLREVRFWLSLKFWTQLLHSAFKP